jgi:hypothetical protein
MAMFDIICYGDLMEETKGVSKMAGKAGSLLLLVGFLTYISAVFSVIPRMFLLVGVILIVLSFAAFFVEDFAPRT